MMKAGADMTTNGQRIAVSMSRSQLVRELEKLFPQAFFEPTTLNLVIANILLTELWQLHTEEAIKRWVLDYEIYRHITQHLASIYHMTTVAITIFIFSFNDCIFSSNEWDMSGTWVMDATIQNLQRDFGRCFSTSKCYRFAYFFWEFQFFSAAPSPTRAMRHRQFIVS